MSITPEKKKEVEDKVRAFIADIECAAFLIALNFGDGLTDTYFKGKGSEDKLLAMAAELTENVV